MTVERPKTRIRATSLNGPPRADLSSGVRLGVPRERLAPGCLSRRRTVSPDRAWNDGNDALRSEALLR
jgi:hypothetical protein